MAEDCLDCSQEDASYLNQQKQEFLLYACLPPPCFNSMHHTTHNPSPGPAVWHPFQMGLVSQECLLFQGTVEDNIRYGCEGATSEQVVAAARAAYAHEFIKAMPQVRNSSQCLVSQDLVSLTALCISQQTSLMFKSA